MAHLQN